MFRLLLTFLLLLRLYSGLAQETVVKPAFRANVSLHEGFFIAHRAAIFGLQRDHVRITEISLLKQTNGSKEWHSLYQYPCIGFKYAYLDLGNPRETGFAHAFHPYIDFNFSKKEAVSLHFGFGIGAAYFNKRFDVKNNYRNLAMGSAFSFAITISTMLEWKVARGLSVNSGISFNHFSNGAIKTPNLGFNIPSARIGITHPFGKTNLISPKENFLQEKKWRNSICVGAGIKQRYPVNGPYYGVVSISFAGMKQLTKKSAAGAGIDMHYDESLHTLLAGENGEKAPVSNAIRAGFCLSYELIFSDFSLLFQGGRYVYSKHNSEGSFYQRLGMRYLFNKNWFACINLRSHFGKADFFETGAGYKF
jgi:hypothetical protein